VHELVIEARGLTKRFGKVVALDGLDLEVEDGASLAILGPAGSGKSTALRLLAGLSRPSAGRVIVANAPPASRAGVAGRARIGVLDQEPAFYDWMTGRELLVFVADLHGLAHGELADRLVRALERTGLAEVADRQIDGYSLPARQRLGVAQAVLADPQVLLLDEPLGWLDAAGRSEILGLLADLLGSTSMLVATSDVSLAEALCDRVAVLDAGRMLSTGRTDEVLARLGPRDYVIDTVPGSGLALAGLLARLSSEPWVRAVEGLDGSVRVAVRDERRADRELLPAVVATGLTVLGLRRERPGIERLVDELRGEAA
jgi:ABC-2 type transport system ATP-binding protein